MKDRTQMTRTCSACGLEKPLAAFLEISSTHGTRYGTICATCRGAGITEKKNNKAEEDQSTIATSGTRIGLKERVFIEKKQKEQLSTAKEQRIDQLIKRDALQEEKKDKTNLKEKSEKDHRYSYLDTKKQPSFLNKTATKTPPITTLLPEIKIERDKMIVEEKQRTIDARQEEMKKTFNLVDQYIDPQAGESRAYAAPWIDFLTRIGGAAPVNLIRNQLQLQKLTSPQTETARKTDSTTKDPLLDFVEKTWTGPSTTRRR
jgi:hypothetical protein